MILYHFCAAKHVKNILRKGLTMGGVTEVTPKGFVIHQGWNWLTLNGNPKEQSWEGRILIPYSRTAFRLTINIPDDALDRLYDRERLLTVFPYSEPLFRGHPESEDWRAFQGMIPREWIIDSKDMRNGGVPNEVP